MAEESAPLLAASARTLEKAAAAAEGERKG